MGAKTLTWRKAYNEIIPDRVLEEFDEGEDFTAAEVCPDGYYAHHLGMYLSRWQTASGDGVYSDLNSRGKGTYTILDMEKAKEGLRLLREGKEDGRVDRERAQEVIMRELDGEEPSLEGITNILADNGIGNDIPRRIELAREMLTHLGG